MPSTNNKGITELLGSVEVPFLFSAIALCGHALNAFGFSN